MSDTKKIDANVEKVYRGAEVTKYVRADFARQLVANLERQRDESQREVAEIKAKTIEECAKVVESQQLTVPANFGGNKWGAAGAMQALCAAAIRALKGKP